MAFFLEKQATRSRAARNAQSNSTTEKLPSLSTSTLRSQDSLRDALKAAITKDDAHRIESSIRRGAPLYAHYFAGVSGPHDPDSPLVQQLGMVNPVDWAMLSLRFRAAMQILELTAGRFKNTEVRPRPKELEEHKLAAETRVALTIAAKHGHLGLMRMLLEGGCAVGQKDLGGKSALRIATECNKVEAVSLLLQYGAWKVEEQPQQVLAAVPETAPMMTLFISAGATLPAVVDAPSDCRSIPQEPVGSSPERSPSKPHDGCPPDIAQVVLSPGARRQAWAKDGPVLASTYDGIFARSPRPDGLITPVWGWAPHGSMPSTALSAAAGGAVAVPTPGTALHNDTNVGFLRELTSQEAALRGELCTAIRKGNKDRVHGLLERGAPLEAAFDLGYGERGNCIDWACVNERPQLALYLLTVADKRGQGDNLAVSARAAFFWSVTQGYSDVLEELLRRGADVSQKSPIKTLEIGAPTNQSALTAAVFGARKPEIATLLRYGAWESETDASRAQLLEWSTCRRPVADAFREAGILEDIIEDRLSPMDPSMKFGFVDRDATATPSTRAPTSMAMERGETPF